MGRKKVQPFWNRQRYLVVLALLLVGAILVSPTLSPFSASDDDLGRDVPTFPEIPEAEETTGYETGVLTAYIGLSTTTVHPSDSVKVYITWDWDEGFLSYEENTDGFALAIDPSGGGDIYCYYTTSPSQITPTRITAVWGELDRAHTATIPAQSAGTTVTAYAEVNVGGDSATSGTVSYTVSEESNDDPPDMTGPGWDTNVQYTTGDVSLEDGTVFTWDELATATIYGVVSMSIEFSSGWDRVLGVTLIVERLDDEGSGYWYWGELEDGKTWTLEWNTRMIEDGEYHIEIGANIWESTTELPPGLSGPPSGDYYWVAFSAFDVGGSGGTFTGFSNVELVAIGIVFVVIIGIVGYRQMNLKKRRRR